MSNPTITTHTAQLQTWLRAAQGGLNRSSNSDAPSDLAAWYDLVRRELSRHAAALNERNLFAALSTGLLCRILRFTRIEDCIRVMQTCSLLRSKLLELPHLWAAASANGAELHDWHVDGEVERTSAVAKLSFPEPLMHLRVVWMPEHSAALTPLVHNTLPRTQSLSIIVPVGPRGGRHFPPHADDDYDPRKQAMDVANALIVPAPLLKSLSIMFFYPFRPGFQDTAELPSSLFAGDASMLLECSLTHVKLPRSGCAAFANVRRFDWRHDRKELGTADVLSMLNSFPQLEVLKITVMALSWDTAEYDAPPRRSVRNVQLIAVCEMRNIADFLVDLGVERFAFSERLLVPDIAFWNDLAFSPFEFAFTTIAVGLRLCEATVHMPSSNRDLLVRCRPSYITDYFEEVLPGMPTVSTLPMLTSLCIHEFYWPPVPDNMPMAIGVNIPLPTAALPRLPALRTLRVLLASCLDYYTEMDDAVGVLQHPDLRIWDTPMLEMLHLSYHLPQSCGSKSYWNLNQPLMDPRTMPACCCKQTLTLSLLDVHVFVKRFVTRGYSNPSRLRRLILTGVESIDPDGGVSGMRLLNSLADEVRISPRSEPVNCDASNDVWWTLDSIFLDELPVSSAGVLCQ